MADKDKKVISGAPLKVNRPSGQSGSVSAKKLAGLQEAVEAGRSLKKKINEASKVSKDDLNKPVSSI